MAVDVQIEPEALTGLGAFPRDALHEAYALLMRLKTQPRLGQRLSNHPDVGDLSGCRKLYIGGARFRVVYVLEPDEHNPKTARVIAAGRRANYAVYLAAVRQLGRVAGVDSPPR